MNSLQKVSTNFYQSSKTEQWKELFNQATFFNFDTANTVNIQKWVLPPATSVTTGAGTFIYPSYLSINLNVGEINNTMFIIDCKNSSTANWQIIYTQYLGVQ
jgi:hypothetical protein